MVTHNPELAQQYATRIVELKDGKIRSDSDAFYVDEETVNEKCVIISQHSDTAGPATA